MPSISHFYGISIWIYYDEIHHQGLPHFHAYYGGHWASFTIEPTHALAGKLPRTATRLVREWGAAHYGELLANWERAKRHEPLVPVAPLP